MESYIEYFGDTIDDIRLLFGEDDPSLVVVREHAKSHLHSLLDQSFKVDMMVDPLIQKLEDVTLFLKEIFESLIHALRSSLVEPNLSFLAEWHRTHDLDEALFRIDMGTLEKVLEIPYILRFLPIDGRGFIDKNLVMFLPKGRNIFLHSWSSFYINLGASSIGVHSTLRGGYLVYLHLLLSYGGIFSSHEVFFSLIFFYSTYLSFWRVFFHAIFPLFLLYARLHCIYTHPPEVDYPLLCMNLCEKIRG